MSHNTPQLVLPTPAQLEWMEAGIGAIIHLDVQVFEPSYNGNPLGAYVEFRDERVAFFVRQLMRGKHSISYRLRAEIPGQFSALPTRASGMYAPELKANSDEIKVKIID